MNDWPLLDKYGLTPIPQRLYWLLVLLLRPYLSWVLVLTLPPQQKDLLKLFYPQQLDFIVACCIALPVLLVVAALTQRSDKRSMAWRGMWRFSQPVLLVCCVADLLYTLYDLPTDAILDAPWRLSTVVALGIAVFWLLRSKTLPTVFKEWPEPVSKN